MPEQPERLRISFPSLQTPMVTDPEGPFVRYSDYEKLEEERAFQTEEATNFHDRALVAEKRLGDAEAERDSLRSKVEAEVARLLCEADDLDTSAFVRDQARLVADRLQALLDDHPESGEG